MNIGDRVLVNIVGIPGLDRTAAHVILPDRDGFTRVISARGDQYELATSSLEPLPPKPKRFLVFSYWTYYPEGGWADFSSSWETLEEAVFAARRELTCGISPADWAHVVDLELGIKVFDSDRDTEAKME